MWYKNVCDKIKMLDFRNLLKGAHIFFFFLLVVINPGKTTAQSKTESKVQKYGVAFIPSLAHNIYGLAIGPIGSESICGEFHYKKSHGINIQILGQGVIWMLNKKPGSEVLYKVDTSYYPEDTLKKYDMKRAIHNGLLISPLGAIQTSINGLDISFLCSEGPSLKGLSIASVYNQFNQIKGLCIGLVNKSGSSKGVQIGLINNSHQLKGIQLGLWNKSSQRKMPLINWGF